MRGRLSRGLAAAVLAALVGLAACVPVTVNITFPQEKLEGAASRIEDMVRSPDNPPPARPPQKPRSDGPAPGPVAGGPLGERAAAPAGAAAGPGARLAAEQPGVLEGVPEGVPRWLVARGPRVLARLVWLGPRPAHAQGRQVDVVPEIRVQTPELMRAIEARRARNPQIEQWKSRGCIGENNQGLLELRPGQGCAGEVAALVAAENANREYIYRTLMQQNNIPASDAGRVRAAFAKVNRDRARPGEWVQEPDGRWVRR